MTQSGNLLSIVSVSLTYSTYTICQGRSTNLNSTAPITTSSQSYANPPLNMSPSTSKTMPSSYLDPTTLTSFADAAAGQSVTQSCPSKETETDPIPSDGVLSDPSGTLVIKPCTAAEISFYEFVNASRTYLAPFLPRFMGKLQLASTTPLAAAAAAATAGTASTSGTAATLAPSNSGPMKGKALDTDLHIVLENVASGFVRPNILDLKPGARLWADDAPLAKRARLDAVAEKTTSGSLGFRISGMRVWQGKKEATGKVEFAEVEKGSNIRVYNKLYGRQFTEETVIEGFREYLLVPDAGVDADLAARLLRDFIKDIRKLQESLEASESRMFSSSILLVYEGDGEAYLEKERELSVAAVCPQKVESEDEDDEDLSDEDEEEEKKLYAVKIIDFAHATWTPGLGPDENMLQGVRSVLKILEDLQKKI
jgi:inositol-polyphosphate multikinase